jgi:hypothetical protein
LVYGTVEEEAARFFLSRQHDRTPATFTNVIDFLLAKGLAVDTFWVTHFVQSQQARLCTQKAKILDKERNDVSPDDL